MASASETKPLIGTGVPESMAYPILAVMLISVIGFGSQVAYFSISALAPGLKHSMELDSRDIAALYSAYHLPNLVAVVLGGILADSMGCVRASVVFSGVTLAGTWLVSRASSYEAMLVGRFLFGIGSESLCVTQLALCTRWFRVPRGILSLPTTFAFCDVFNRLGGIFAFNVVAFLAAADTLATAHLCVLLTVVGSATANLVLAGVDVLATRTGVLAPEPAAPTRTPWAGVRDLPPVYWLLVTISLCTYASILTFTDFAVDYLYEAYGLSPVHASKVASSLTGVCLVMSPVVGVSVDRLGHRLAFMTAGTALLAATLAVVVAGALPPVLGFLAMGTSLSLIASSLWSCIPLVTPAALMNTAFGVMQGLQNLALLVVPMAVAALHDATGSYTPGFGLLVALEGVALAACLAASADSSPLAQLLSLPSAGLHKVVSVQHEA